MVCFRMSRVFVIMVDEIMAKSPSTIIDTVTIIITITIICTIITVIITVTITISITISITVISNMVYIYIYNVCMKGDHLLHRPPPHSRGPQHCSHEHGGRGAVKP